MLSAQEIATRSTDWVLLVLAFITITVVIAKVSETERTVYFLGLPFRVQSSEWAANFNPILSKKLSDALLGLAAILTLALAALLITRFWRGEQTLASDFLPFLKMVFTLIGIFLGKTLLGSFIAAVFDVQEQITAAQNINLAYLSWLLVPILPLVLATLFLNWQTAFFAQLLLVVVLVGLAIMMWHTARAIINVSPILSYNIFYLCALEIIPIIYLIFLLQKI